MRAAQLDYEINRDIYVANILFKLGKGMYLLVHFSFKIFVSDYSKMIIFIKQSQFRVIKSILIKKSTWVCIICKWHLVLHV